MKACVLDASVAAKWCLPAATEPLATEAMQILRAHSAGSLRLLVSDLFWLEVGNVLWNAARRGRLPWASAEESIAKLRSKRISTEATAPLLPEAFAIAAAYNRSVYDSAYVAPAVLSDMPLLTADERLANALASRFPIRWLGAI